MGELLADYFSGLIPFPFRQSSIIFGHIKGFIKRNEEIPDSGVPLPLSRAAGSATG
jgi:hypothetical protein